MNTTTLVTEKQDTKGGQFNTWLVKNAAGFVVGFIRKGKAAKGYNFPAQAFLPAINLTTPAELLGSFYGKSGMDEALAAIAARN